MDGFPSESQNGATFQRLVVSSQMVKFHESNLGVSGFVSLFRGPSVGERFAGGLMYREIKKVNSRKAHFK